MVILYLLYDIMLMLIARISVISVRNQVKAKSSLGILEEQIDVFFSLGRRLFILDESW